MRTVTVRQLRNHITPTYMVHAEEQISDENGTSFLNTTINIQEDLVHGIALKYAFGAVANFTPTPLSALRKVANEVGPKWKFWTQKGKILLDIWHYFRTISAPQTNFIELDNAMEVTVSVDELPSVGDKWYVCVTKENKLSPGVYEATITKIRPFWIDVSQTALAFELSYEVIDSEGLECRGNFHYSKPSLNTAFKADRVYWTMHSLETHAQDTFKQSMNEQINTLQAQLTNHT